MTKKIILIIYCLIIINFPLQALTVTLTWENNSEPDISHYIVYWGTTTGTYTWNSGNIGLVTTYTVTIPDGTQVYYFAVTAVDGEGLESDYSNEVNTIGITGRKLIKLKFITNGSKIKIDINGSKIKLLN